MLTICAHACKSSNFWCTEGLSHDSWSGHPFLPYDRVYVLLTLAVSEERPCLSYLLFEFSCSVLILFINIIIYANIQLKYPMQVHYLIQC